MGGRVRDKVVAARGRRGHRWPTPLSTPRNTQRRETRGNGTNDRWDSAPLRAWHRYIPPLFLPLTHGKAVGEPPPPFDGVLRRLVGTMHVVPEKFYAQSRRWRTVRSAPDAPSYSGLMNIVDIKKNQPDWKADKSANKKNIICCGINCMV